MNGGQIIVDYLIQQKGSLSVRSVRSRQHQLDRCILRAVQRDQSAFRSPRVGFRLYGRLLLPGLRAAGRHFYLLRAGIGEHAHLPGQLLLRLGAFPGCHSQRTDQPVQPRSLPGNLSPFPGGFPLHGAGLLQARLPAHPGGPGRAERPAGVEDDGHRPAGSGSARRAV